MERCPITITLPDGKQIDGTAWETTPLAIAASLSKSLAERTVIAKVLILKMDQKITLLQVDGVLFDLTRPLEKSCNLQLLDFETDDGKKVILYMIFLRVGLLAFFCSCPRRGL
jgi:threonyl-tRNA synthetase